MSYKHYTNETLETFARKVIAQYDPNILYVPSRTPIEEIMEKVYDLTLEYQYIRKNGRILGETVFEDTEIPIYDKDNKCYKIVLAKAGTVILDASLLDKQQDWRYIFTCAHELAHWILDKDYFAQRGETAALTECVAKSSCVADAVERQANRLASCILMPKCTVKTAFYDQRNKSSKTLQVVAGLASIYGVSRQAMEIRLEQLGLTD